MSRILIEYDPKISFKAKAIIENTISPSMSSNDGESHQYNLDFILEGSKGFILTDKRELKRLQADGVEYLEF